MKKVLLLFALMTLFVSIPAMAQEGEPAYRLSGYAASSNLADANQFTVGAGLERVIGVGVAAGTEFRQNFGPDALSSVSASARYYINQGGKVEVFALGEYAAQMVEEPDVAAFGGGVNLFVLPNLENLGFRLEIKDDVSTTNGDQKAALRFGLVFRF